MLWLYLKFSIGCGPSRRKCDGAHRGQRQKAVHIQLHQAKNEQPQGEKLQNRAAWIDPSFIKSFDCRLRVIMPLLIAKSKGERSFEVHQSSRTPWASTIRPQAFRWQPTAQDASEPTRKRLIHQAWNMTGFVCVIPSSLHTSEAGVIGSIQNKISVRRHQNLQHFDRLLESMTWEYETEWSHPLPPLILRMCSASLASSWPWICSIRRLCEWTTSRNSLRQVSF